MHENRPSLLPVCKVGLAWETGDMLSEADAKTVNGGTRNDLGTRLMGSDARHDLRAGERRPLASREYLWNGRAHLKQSLSGGFAVTAAQRQNRSTRGE
jgi:hypothetical protein